MLHTVIEREKEHKDSDRMISTTCVCVHASAQLIWSCCLCANAFCILQETSFTGIFAHFNASYKTLNSFFCNVVLEIPFIFLVLHVNWSNFDLLTSHIKKLYVLACKIMCKKLV